MAQLKDLLNGNEPDFYLFSYQVNKILDTIAKDFECPVKEWGIIEWKSVAKTILFEKVKLELEHEAVIDFSTDMLVEIKRRRKLDKDRIKNRPDQVDKRAFQDAVKINIEDYPRKADAIRDLKIKPQFADYPDSTLRNWLKDIWNKPTKRGASKKANK